MSFQAPLLLASLAIVPLVAIAYALAQRRRRRYAIHYTNVDLLATVVGRSYTLHLPALLGLLALTALLLAIARPQHTGAAERREANVMLVTDTSGSMLATDIEPSRLVAGQAAAREFTRKLPAQFRLGLVSFSSTADERVAPTTDHARVVMALDALKPHGVTAMGDALQLAIDAARAPVRDIAGGSHRLPAAIILLSDGVSTRGADPIDVAQNSKRSRIPIYTVALGTRTGVLVHRNPRTGAVIRIEKVPPDPLTLQDIARETGGQFFAAPTPTSSPPSTKTSGPGSPTSKNNAKSPPPSPARHSYCCSPPPASASSAPAYCRDLVLAVAPGRLPRPEPGSGRRATPAGAMSLSAEPGSTPCLVRSFNVFRQPERRRSRPMRQPASAFARQVRKTCAVESPASFSTEQARAIGERIGIDWRTSRFDVQQFRLGLGVELEHGRRDPATNVSDDDEVTTGKIAWAHLNEFPDYYTRLATMEAEAERYWAERDKPA